MDTFQAIRERRAIKSFDATHRFSQQEEDLLIDMATQAPSSFNIQHWRLVNVKDTELRARIRAAAVDQPQVTDASLLYVICADVKAWQKEPNRYYRNAPQEVQNLLVPWMKDFYEYNEQLQRDEAVRSASFIAHTMMLSAKAMGYDSCPLIGFNPIEVARLINLPDNHIIAMMLAIGKGTNLPWPKPGYVDRKEILFENSF
ncbi:nitroreductase family protein [Caballeronia insecticola]|uniref:Nitroreductase n=1 Tax=Caballeronia insecticola TaxID=758793 RepID=A0A060PRV1_9BURK|nr:nitroreductase family protein [Caballeronia insecticola]BAO94170.1 nitroreductase [Caballeronia insecticola]